MSRVSKALAGGLAGAVTAAGTFTTSGGDPVDELGKFALALAAGFAVGFIGVYVAPANSGR